MRFVKVSSAKSPAVVPKLSIEFSEESVVSANPNLEWVGSRTFFREVSLSLRLSVFGAMLTAWLMQFRLHV